MSELPLVSVIVPCRNEERFIGVCLDSISANDYPKDRLEVFIVDGMSEDGTRKIIEEYVSKNPFIRLMDNPEKITPCGLNRGIKQARGEYILWMSAHNKYSDDYIRQCVEYLIKSNPNVMFFICVASYKLPPRFTLESVNGNNIERVLGKTK